MRSCGAGRYPSSVFGSGGEVVDMGREHRDLRRTRASLFYLVAYLFPFAAGLLISPTGTFHLLGSRAEHAAVAWRLFGGLLLMLAVVVVRLIQKHRAAAYVNTAIVRMAF